MSQPRVDGYQDFLFYDMRRNTAGELTEHFPLNSHPDTSILLCGVNFGTGSSREAAAYALVDAGIKVVIATAFGDIFAANAVNNGLLPAVVNQESKTQLQELLTDSKADECLVNLEQQHLTCGDQMIAFSIDDAWRTKLINGWDDIDLTLSHADAITEFGHHRRTQFSWAWPATT